MKKHLNRWHFGSFIAAFALVVALVVPLSAVAATPLLKLYTAPDAVSVQPGDTFSLQVRLSNTTSSKVDHVNADMRFPADVLEITSITKTGSHFTNGGGPTTSFNNATGTISIVGTGSVLGSPADVLVATIYFKANTAGAGDVIFASGSQAGDMIGADNLKNYLDTTSGSTVTVVSPVSTPPAEEVPPPASSELEPTDVPEQEPAQASAEQPGGQPEVIPEDLPAGGFEGGNPEERTVSRSLPVWPLVFVTVVAIGMAGVGTVAYFLRRQSPRTFSIKHSKKEIGPQVVPPQGEAGASEEDRDIAASVAVGPLEPAKSSPSSPSPVTPSRLAAVVPSKESVPRTAHVKSAASVVHPAATPPQRPVVVPVVPAPRQEAVPSVPPSEDPLDMFDVGAARLQAEGLNDRVRSSAAPRDKTTPV